MTIDEVVLTKEARYEAYRQLMEFKNWICWGDRKVPIAYGYTYPTSATDPALWQTYDKCIDWRDEKKLKGIGFAFSLDVGVVGLDVDKCVDEDGNIDREVQFLIDYMDSYTEYSQSGRGIHILIFGKKNSPKSEFPLPNGMTLEVYDQKRFFAMTGNKVIGTPSEINERTDRLSSIIAEKQTNTADDILIAPSLVSIDDVQYLQLNEELESKIKFAESRIASAVDGLKHKTRYRMAYMIGGYYATYIAAGFTDITKDSILTRLYDANVPGGDNKDQVREFKAIQDGMDGGMSRPLAFVKSTPKSMPVERAITVDCDEECEQEIQARAFTDSAWAGAIARMMSKDENHLYCVDEEEWYSWQENNGIWLLNNKSNIVNQLIGEYIHEMLSNGFAGLTDARRFQLKNSCGQLPFIKRVRECLQQHQGLYIKSAKFNMELDCLPVKNGVIELRTGNIREYRKHDYWTTSIDINYVPNAKSPMLESFMQKICQIGGQYNQHQYNFLQQLAGYTLTGRTNNHYIFFLYGTGGNGKSTFINNVLCGIGENDFTTVINSNTLVGNGGSESSTNSDVASIRNKRLVFAEELPNGKRLNEDLLKGLSSGSYISSAEKYKSVIKWTSRAKIVFTGNARPNITNVTHGLLRRFIEIPFTAELDKTMSDDEVSDSFTREREGVLAWRVQGAIEAYKHNLMMPLEQFPHLKEISNEIKSEADLVGQFIAECCVVSAESGDKVYVSKALAYQVYKHWHGTNNDKRTICFSNRVFGGRMKEKCKEGKKGNSYYIGIEISREYIERFGVEIPFGEFTSIALVSKETSAFKDKEVQAPAIHSLPVPTVSISQGDIWSGEVVVSYPEQMTSVDDSNAEQDDYADILLQQLTDNPDLLIDDNE